MRIAVDAMGGDCAPGEIVAGAVEASRDFRLEIILVGDRDIVQRELDQHDVTGTQITICHAPQAVEMNEHATVVLKKKKDASIMIASALVKEKKADALVSCGNTGAQLAAAIFVLGRFDGIERPPIVARVPGVNGHVTAMLDMGANVDVKPAQMVQFARMGGAFARAAMGVKNPRIALLSNGEEETKGNQATLAAHAELKAAPDIHFMGNIEGRDLFAGRADVVVCDGFVGNTVLKTIEGLSQLVMDSLQPVYGPGVLEHLAALDYAKTGGAPLLGVDGISIVCHGRSRREAVCNGIRMACTCVESGLVAAMKNALETENKG
ncbi:MAG: phosphate acyltransferase PlsX [Solirubrobacterales bacterium]